MAKSALPESACQLDTRYWKITNANGNVEEVRGPGVVGETIDVQLCTYSVRLFVFKDT